MSFLPSIQHKLLDTVSEVSINIMSMDALIYLFKPHSNFVHNNYCRGEIEVPGRSADWNTDFSPQASTLPASPHTGKPHPELQVH